MCMVLHKGKISFPGEKPEADKAPVSANAKPTIRPQTGSIFSCIGLAVYRKEQAAKTQPKKKPIKKTENKSAIRKPRTAAEQKANIERICSQYGYGGSDSITGIYF